MTSKFNTKEEFFEAASSEKITVAHLRALHRLYNFTKNDIPTGAPDLYYNFDINGLSPITPDLNEGYGGDPEALMITTNIEGATDSFIDEDGWLDLSPSEGKRYITFDNYSGGVLLGQKGCIRLKFQKTDTTTPLATINFDVDRAHGPHIQLFISNQVIGAFVKDDGSIADFVTFGVAQIADIDKVYELELNYDASDPTNTKVWAFIDGVQHEPTFTIDWQDPNFTFEPADKNTPFKSTIEIGLDGNNTDPNLKVQDLSFFSNPQNVEDYTPTKTYFPEFPEELKEAWEAYSVEREEFYDSLPLFYVSWEGQLDALYSEGDATVSAFNEGGANTNFLEGGFLNLYPDTGVRWVSIDPTNNLNSQKGSILLETVIKNTLNISSILTIKENDTDDLKSGIFLSKGADQLAIIVSDQNEIPVLASAFATQLEEDVLYQIELNYDFDAGRIWIYVNGELEYNETFTPFTRETSQVFALGNDYSSDPPTNNTEIQVRDLSLWDAPRRPHTDESYDWVGAAQINLTPPAHPSEYPSPTISYMEREVDYFVDRVVVDNVTLTEVSTSEEVAAGLGFSFNQQTYTLQVPYFDQDENGRCLARYRMFYSSAPLKTVWNLPEEDNGTVVDYDARIFSAPGFSAEMSQGKRGINLIGSGEIRLNNSDGHFDNIYDNLIWDNQECSIYTFHRDLPPTEAKLLFRGNITERSFNDNSVSFTLNDSLFALNRPFNTQPYSVRYPNLPERVGAFYERVIYGRADGVLCQTLDPVGDEGILSTGVISGNRGEQTVEGIGTLFRSEVSPDDRITVLGQSIRVREVKSDTLLVVSSLDSSFREREFRVRPNIPFYKANRNFKVSGHALSRSKAIITDIKAANRFVVDSANGKFRAGDFVEINGQTRTVKRVTGNEVVLTVFLNVNVSIGDVIERNEIFDFKYKDISIPATEIEITNDQEEGCSFRISDRAEFLATIPQRNTGNFRFTQGSRQVHLGMPTIFNMEIDFTPLNPSQITAGNSHPLWGTYFVAFDQDGNEIAFWFSDMAIIQSTAVPEPGHGLERSYRIQIRNSANVATVRNRIRDAMIKELDFFEITIVDGVEGELRFVTKNAGDITLPSPETSSSYISTELEQQGFVSNADIDLKHILKPRDFIKPADDINYLEILSVDESSLTLREPYELSTKTSFMDYRDITYINDDTPVTVSVWGKTKDGSPDGELVQTVPEVVEDLLLEAQLGDFIDDVTFEDAKSRAPDLVSMCLPLNPRSTPETIEELINRLNRTVIGSLYIREPNLLLGYDILDATVPDNITRRLGEDDVIQWSTSSDGFDLKGEILARYSFKDYDPIEDSNSSSVINFKSERASLIDVEALEEVDMHLYNPSEAREAAQREAFYNEINNTIISITGGLNLAKHFLSERVTITFQGLFRPKGVTTITDRLGIITSVNKSPDGRVDLTIEDVGSLFTRAIRIVDDNEPIESYQEASDTQRVRIGGFIMGNNGIIDDIENTQDTNVIT